MALPIANESFAVWREDARRLTAEDIPDALIPIIGLVAVYSVSSEQKTVHDWSRHINADVLTAKALARLLPAFDREEFNDLSPLPLWSVKPLPGAPSRTQTEFIAIRDGLPPRERAISKRDYYLGRMVGQAICNYAVTHNPLDISLSVARPVLAELFPRSLEYATGPQ